MVILSLVASVVSLLIGLAWAVSGLDDGGMIETSHPSRSRSRSPGKSILRNSAAFAALIAALGCAAPMAWGDGGSDTNAADTLVPLKLKLPPPAFVGTPQNVPVGSDVEPISAKPRPPLPVPPGLSNLAPASKISSSDTNATPEGLAKIVDGEKRATDSGVVLLRKGTQFVQFDLGARYELFAVVIWHAHDAAKVYHDVVVQVADDPAFTGNVRTLFNNDKDNSSKLGVGADREYFETYEGKLVDARGVVGRYVRTYSRGSTESALNEYTEVEIYGRPAK